MDWDVDWLEGDDGAARDRPATPPPSSATREPAAWNAEEPALDAEDPGAEGLAEPGTADSAVETPASSPEEEAPAAWNAEPAAWNAEQDPDGAPPSWARLPGEPMQWYRRFEFYRMMPERTLLGSFRQYTLGLLDPADTARRSNIQRRTQVPRTWREAAKTWRWKQRAEDWDTHESQRIAREFETERAEDRRRRIDVLRAYRAKLTQALTFLDPRDATWKVVTEGLAMVSKELRTEYDGAGLGATNLDVDIELKWNDRPAEPPAESAEGSRARDAEALGREG